jgi:hypothetical protein
MVVLAFILTTLAYAFDISSVYLSGPEPHVALAGYNIGMQSETFKISKSGE